MSEHWLWTQKEDIGPSPRYGHVMAYDAARQRVVLFGGSDMMDRRFNDTWEWDGHVWTQVADMGPSGRRYCGMACDDFRQRLVLFGGLALTIGGLSEHNGDTWEWDGTQWTQVADIGPARRQGCALTYDTVRQRAVLFGGYDSDSGKYFDDTWEWDGTEWTQNADTGPPARANPTMVFDRSRECVVLFGGWGLLGPGWLGDTWEWCEDAEWVKRQEMGPQSIVGPVMTYIEQRTVLFGAPRLEAWKAGLTWEWDSRLWTQRQNMGPPARGGHALAYDNQRDRVVLFGGWSYSAGGTQPPPITFGDTWELAIIEQ